MACAPSSCTQSIHHATGRRCWSFHELQHWAKTVTDNKIQHPVEGWWLHSILSTLLDSFLRCSAPWLVHSFNIERTGWSNSLTLSTLVDSLLQHRAHWLNNYFNIEHVGWMLQHWAHWLIHYFVTEHIGWFMASTLRTSVAYIFNNDYLYMVESTLQYWAHWLIR